MARKTPPFKHYPQWTEARFWGFIRSGLRQMASRYPVKFAVLAAAQRGTAALGAPYTGKGPKQGMNRVVKAYECNECKQLFKQKDVQVDHIVPAGTLKSYEDVSGFTERLFCGPEGMQILCTTCHNIKTKMEKENVRISKV